MPPKQKTPPPPPKLSKRVVLTVINHKGGTTKCLAGDTLIPDPVTGVPRTLHEVMTDPQHDQVVTLRDRTTIVPAPIAAKVDNGVRPTLKVTFASGRSVTCTPNHPFLLPDGWRRADELTIGHTAALPRRLPHPSDPVRLKDAEVTMLALLLAEGGLSQRQARFSTADPEMLRRATDAAQALGWTVTHIGRYDYRINGPRLAGPMAFAREHGIAKLAKHKTMPTAVYRLPEDQLADFLGIFWMCDGSMPKDGPRVVLASESLVRALQHLLLRFGVQSTVRRADAKLNGKAFEAWRLSVPKVSWPAFLTHIPLWGEKKERLISMAEQPGTSNLGFPTMTEPLRQRLRELAPTARGKAGAPTMRMVGERLGYNRGHFQFSFLVNGGSGQICRGPLRAFAEVFGVEDELSWLYRTDTDVYWDRIVSVEPAGEQQVYDLTVDETHCFVANDVIVHNTTTAVNLGAAFAEMGLTVRVIDADPQAGSVTHWLPPQQEVETGLLEVYKTLLYGTGNLTIDHVTSLTTVENLLIVPSWTSMRVVEQDRLAGADQVLRRALAGSDAEVNIDIIDAPHTLDVIAVGAIAAADEIIIPLQASDLDTVGMQELLDVLDRVQRLMDRPDLRIAAIVVGRTKPNSIFDTQLIEGFRDAYPGAVIGSVPDTVKMREATTAHLPITVYAPKEKASKAFRAMAQELVRRWVVPAAEEADQAAEVVA
jgi:cellulose biosynthesis protein BcsQ/intein/homing endonuclease